MLRYGKMAQHAVSSVYRLATLYDNPTRTASSAEIARECRVSKALAAKILNTLASHHLVAGSPGPGGGYRLKVPPAKLSLYTVVCLFEHGIKETKCPFGRILCNGSPCAVHGEVVAIQTQIQAFLKRTTFATLAGNKIVKRARGKAKQV